MTTERQGYLGRTFCLPKRGAGDGSLGAQQELLGHVSTQPWSTRPSLGHVRVQLQTPGRPAFYFCSRTLSYLLIISPRSLRVFVGVRVPLGRAGQSSPRHQAQKRTPGRECLASMPGSSRNPKVSRAGAELGCVGHNLYPSLPPDRLLPEPPRTEAAPPA